MNNQATHLFKQSAFSKCLLKYLKSGPATEKALSELTAIDFPHLAASDFALHLSILESLHLVSCEKVSFGGREIVLYELTHIGSVLVEADLESRIAG